MALRCEPPLVVGLEPRRLDADVFAVLGQSRSPTAVEWPAEARRLVLGELEDRLASASSLLEDRVGDLPQQNSSTGSGRSKKNSSR